MPESQKRKYKQRADMKWSSAVAESVLSLIESGSTLAQAAEKNGISASSIIRHVHQDDGFAKCYTRAMSIRTDKDFEDLDKEIECLPEMVKTKTGQAVDSGWVNWQRLRIDTKKWILAHREPQKYSDKYLVGGDSENPVELVIKHVGGE
jgi:hypothetical protein